MNIKRVTLLSLFVAIALCVALLSATATTSRADDAAAAAAATETINDNNSSANMIDNPVDTDIVRLQETLDASGEKLEFQAEINKLLGIIINSLYTNKEIFLRELISNASDALDKIRFISLTDKTALSSDPSLEIEVSANRDKRTLTIRDSGIGMTRSDLVNNLGTIANSGTKAFLEKLKSQAETTSNLIGQFGVGFYSAFLVADRVTVVTKHNDDDQYVWSSTADGSYAIVKDPRGNTLKRGTEITLLLKDDALEEYGKTENLKKLIERYSEFIQFPIKLWTVKTESREVLVEDDEESTAPAAEEEEKEEKKEEDGDVDVETTTTNVTTEDEDADSGSNKQPPKTKTVTETTADWNVINTNKPIWTRDSKDVTKDEYDSFYKATTKEIDEPMAHIHFKGEGNVDFKSILYIPGHPPFDMFDVHRKSASIKLYVKRVYITDQIADMMPRYLNFIRGVVDSEDLPLNISRELLQNSKLLRLIKKKLVTKAISMIRQMAEAEQKARLKEDSKKEGEQEEEEEKSEDEVSPMLFQRFWKDFGKNIRLGIIEDTENRPRLIKFLRYYSTKSEWMMTSLDEYIKRMKPNQKHIYYIAGQSLDEVRKSPYIEELKKRDLEVLYMVDAIDEYTIQNVMEYEGKELMSIARDGLEFPEENPEEAKKLEEEMQREYEPVLTFIKSVMGERIQKAVIGKRLAESPLAIVSPRFGFSANMLRVMNAQTLSGQEQEQMAGMAAKLRIVEINPAHPIMKELNGRVKADQADVLATSSVELLYQTALLRSGFDVGDTSSFANNIFNMMQHTIESTPLAQQEQAQEQTQQTQEQEQQQTSEAQQPSSTEESASAHDEL